MSFFEIPVRKDIFSYNLDINLNDKEYTLIFEYNFRDLSWYISIEGFVYGIRLVNSYDIFQKFDYIDDMPAGIFSVVDKLDQWNDPTIDNFGDTCVVIYDDGL